MARKLYDLAVVTGQYTDNQGNTKKRYKNVGVVMNGDEGTPYILLDRTFNPAGLPNDGRESVLISCYAPKDQNGNQNNHSQQSQQTSTTTSNQYAEHTGSYRHDLDDLDSVPF